MAAPPQTGLAAMTVRAPALQPPASDNAPIRIGLLLPLSGQHAALGEALLQAAQLALFDFADPRLFLLPRDTAGTPEKAASAAENLIAEGAEILLGPVFADAVAAAAEPARRNGLNVIAFSTDRDVAGDNVFLLSFLPEQEIARIIGYAQAQDIWRFAALIPETAYGDRVEEAFRQSASNGATMLPSIAEPPRIGHYWNTPEAMHDSVKRIADYEDRRQALAEQIKLLEKSADPFAKEALEELRHRETLGDVNYDAILVAEGGADLRALAPLLPYYDIDPAKVKFLGTGLWNDPSIHQEPALVGGWFPAPQPEAAARFRAQMQSIYGTNPPPVAALAYDAIALTAVLARNPSATTFSRQALINPDGFVGVNGLFRFHENGLSERGLAVLEVIKTGTRVIDPAPTRFAPMLR
ncbi:MAG TPA: penicillin-binding protein activator [Alphaproteobacteria bacterium]|nr:penicillin-binding protein activator [Alphaproteobacteria bacterium]